MFRAMQRARTNGTRSEEGVVKYCIGDVVLMMSSPGIIVNVGRIMKAALPYLANMAEEAK
jgi:hypothetical protein